MGRLRKKFRRGYRRNIGQAAEASLVLPASLKRSLDFGCTKKQCKDSTFKNAVEYLQTHPKDTIQATEERFSLKYQSLWKHIGKYHPQELKKRSKRKINLKCTEKRCAHPAYKAAIHHLLKNASKSYTKIAKQFNVPLQSLYSHLDKFHASLTIERRTKIKGLSRKRERPSYSNAKKLVKKHQERLNLFSSTAYRAAHEWRLQHNLPLTPHVVYAKEWKGWHDFLGTKPYFRKWPSYEEAKNIVRKEAAKAGVTGSVTYTKAVAWRERFNLPSVPYKIYKGRGWINWSEFLGKPLEWTSLTDAKELIKKEAATQGITDAATYGKAKEWRKKHNLPAAPDKVYKDQGWVGWDDFFGRNKVDFKTAKKILAKYAKEMGIVSGYSYRRERAFLEKHNLPARPQIMYSDWKGWPDFLGGPTRVPGRPWSWPSFEEARNKIKLYGKAADITTHEKYIYAKQWRDKHNLPAHPHQIYQKQWKGWAHFLGKTKKINQIKVRRSPSSSEQLALQLVIMCVYLELQYNVKRTGIWWDLSNLVSDSNVTEFFYLDDAYDSRNQTSLMPLSIFQKKFRSFYEKHGHSWGLRLKSSNKTAAMTSGEFFFKIPGSRRNNGEILSEIRKFVGPDARIPEIYIQYLLTDVGVPDIDTVESTMGALATELKQLRKLHQQYTERGLKFTKTLSYYLEKLSQKGGPFNPNELFSLLEAANKAKGIFVEKVKRISQAGWECSVEGCKNLIHPTGRPGRPRRKCEEH